MRKLLLGALFAFGSLGAVTATALADAPCPFTANTADDRTATPGQLSFICDASGFLDVDVKVGGGGGSGGGGTFTPPYNAASGQSAQTSSFLGAAWWNGTTIDAGRGGPAGTGVSAGTAGIQYVQGPGTGGSMPVTIATTVPVSIASAIPVTVQNSPLPVSTPSPNSAAVPGQAVEAYMLGSTSGGNYSPLSLNGSGFLQVNSNQAYGASSGQTSSTKSFVGAALWNGTTVDAWFAGAAGATIPTNQAGVAYIQGIGASGAVPVSQSGAWAFSLNGPYSGGAGQTLTSNSFIGIASEDANGTVDPIPLTNGGASLIVSGTQTSGAVGVQVLNTPVPNFSPAPGAAVVAAPAVVAEPVNGTTFPISAASTIPVAQQGNVTANLAAGSAIVGRVGIDQTTPGTTNAISQANNPCSYGTLIYQPITLTAAGTQQLLAASGTKAIYVCEVFVFSPGTTSISLESGTGTNCSTSCAVLTGNAVALTAQTGWVQPAGSIPKYVTPASSSLYIASTGASVAPAGQVVMVQQ